MTQATPAWSTVIRRAIEVVLRSVSTAEPGVIESFDADACTADVQPLLMRIVRSETGKTARRQNVVTHAPVLFVGGGGSRLTFPVKRGDQCLLIVASRAIDRWNEIGEELDPQNERHHHITDAIAIVGLTPQAHAKAVNPDATVLEAADLRLGNSDAAQSSMRADEFLDKLAGTVSVLTALKTFAATCTTVPASVPASTLATAIDTFASLVSTFKTSQVKVP